MDRADKPRLAWYVTVMTESPLGQWRYFVNARRPVVIHAFDSLADAKRRITYTADNTTDLPGQRLIDEGERSRDQVAQAAHDNSGIVYDYYATNFQRDSIDGQGGAIVSTVHFGSSQEEAENAAWISELQQMIYGDGGRIFRPLALGLDVVGHELTHGVTDHTAQLIYEGQSGALNESYSDVFGALIDDKDWTLGEDVVKSPPFPTPVLRSMEDPNLGGNYDPNNPLNGIGQPGHADEYANLPLSRRADNGGVHINSGIPNHAAYLVAQALDRERTGQIYYRTLTQYLTPNADFFDAAAATVRAAQDLYGANEANAVRTAFNQVGIEAGEPDTLPPPAPDQDTIPDVPPVPDQPEPVPQGCSDLIDNGGFESSESWVEVVAGDVAIIDSELPHSGKRSAWLGGTDQERLQLIYQELRVPPNATSVQLSYYRLVHEELSGVAGVLSPDATFSTVIANTDGDVVATVEELTSAQGDDTWRQAEFDLVAVRWQDYPPGLRRREHQRQREQLLRRRCLAGGLHGRRRRAWAAAGRRRPGLYRGHRHRRQHRAGHRGRAGVYYAARGERLGRRRRRHRLRRRGHHLWRHRWGRLLPQRTSPVPRGQVYSAIVIASDYRPIIADDGIEIAPNADNPLVADAQDARRVIEYVRIKCFSLRQSGRDQLHSFSPTGRK